MNPEQPSEASAQEDDYAESSDDVVAAVDLAADASESADEEVVFGLAQPWDPEPDRERMRGWLAIVLVGLLTSVILLPLGGLMADILDTQTCIDFLQTVLPPVIALCGTVFGFYYGSQRSA